MAASLDTRQSNWRQWLAPLLALTVLGVVFFVIHRELAHFHLRNVLAYLRQIPHRAVFGAVACTFGSYALLSLFDAAGLRYIDKPLPYRRVALSSFIAYAVGNNLGAAPITGGAVRYRLYTAAQLSGPQIAALQGFCSVTAGIGMTILIGASLLASPDEAAAALHLLRPWSAIVGVLLLGLVLAYALWGALEVKTFDLRGWRLHPPGAALTGIQIVLGAADLCVAAAVLWWLLPPEIHVGFVGYLGVYAIAITAGVLSNLPGGIGVFESIMLLAFQNVSRDALLGALLAWRAIYFLAPLLLAGLAFAVQELREQRTSLARVETKLAAYVTPIAPQMIGVLTYLAGLVLLISGATPAVHSRLAALSRLVPLPVQEISHLIGSISGLALLVLAWSLLHRVHEAYRLTLLALGAGAAVSILKGLDYEEAIILVIVMAVLWLGRRAFHRRASIIEERFTPAWVASIIGVLGVVVWIGLFAHRHVQYSSELWWTFAVSADAPRMLRASLATILAAGVVLSLNLLRPSRPEPQLPDAKDLELARHIVERSDDTLGNAVLAGDKRILFSDRRDAFIMYQVAHRSWVSLGDPVGPSEAHEDLVWRFRELADRHDGWLVFYQGSAEFLPLYLDVGLAPVKLGEEARVRLPQFSLEGGARAGLRQSHARAQREGASFEIIEVGAADPLLPALRRISDAWLEEKATAEKGFSVGAFREDYIRQFPLAVVRRGEAPVAFANLWRTDTHVELSIDLMRFGPDAPRGAMDYLFAELMLWGRAQGYHWFNLGMAPLSGLEQHPLAPSWHRLGSFVFRHGEHFYNFEGLRRYKAKFGPVWAPKYLAAPAGMLVLPRVLADVSVLISGGVRELLTK